MDDKKDKRQEIMEKYPLLYKDKDAPMTVTAMCWGLDVGLGWLDIIDDLSSKLESEIKKFIEENKDKLSCATCRHSKEEHVNLPRTIKSQWGEYTIKKHEYYPSYPKASQVKEKYGGLRFYMTSQTKEMENLINEATKLCWKTCEYCGKPGELCIDDWWYTTLCSACVVAQNAKGCDYIQVSKLNSEEEKD